MKIYTFLSAEGRVRADLYHDGSVDLVAPIGADPVHIEPEDVEDVASLFLLVAARSERMFHDIGSFPERCPFRRGDGIAFGERCVREVHFDDRHAFSATDRAEPPSG